MGASPKNTFLPNFYIFSTFLHCSPENMKKHIINTNWRGQQPNAGQNVEHCTLLLVYNKTGLQPVSRLVERVHYLGGFSGGSKSLWCHNCADSYIAGFEANIQNKCSKWALVEKTTGKFNDCFLSKTSLTKSFQMIFRGLVGWGVTNPVSRPVFHR